MNNERLSNFAYQILKGHVATDPYQEVVLFAQVLLEMEQSTDDQQRQSLEKQATTMEHAATACLQNRERLLNEYNKALAEQEAQQEQNWLVWDRKGMQA